MNRPWIPLALVGLAAGALLAAPRPACGSDANAVSGEIAVAYAETPDDRTAAKEKESELYDKGTKALDEGNWTEAAAAFSEVVKLGGSRADGATYWVAYSLAKQNRRDEALAILRSFESKYPKSTWRKEARALELEIRPASGRRVIEESTDDEDLKLMAINGLMNSDPEQAIPMLEKVLNGNASPNVKERALFVLAQSDSPRARKLIADFARGSAKPELQEKAIHYLGLNGRANGQLLAEIYASTTSVDVKEKVLHAFMLSGDKERVLGLARTEKNPELRAAAVHQLGIMGARSELWQMYQSETAASVKESILQAMFIAGDVDHVLELARAEKDASLRAAAIHKLGLMGRERAGPALVSIYKSERDPELKKAAIQGLFLQNNGKALVEIARAEKDPHLKADAVSKLSLMRDKDATEYMLEILNR
jgi:tetratricopeptide (TPR) repeat protein